VDPALSELLRSGRPRAAEVEAIVRLRGRARGVPGVRIVSRFGSIATCRLSVATVMSAWHHPYVLSLKPARALGPESEPEPHLDPLPPVLVEGDIRRPAGLPLTGAGVLIGFADWGCDFDHPAFKHRDGSTRLCALWDQRRMTAQGGLWPYGYGTLYRREDIDAALRSGDPYETLGYHPGETDHDRVGMHGSHVMGIAAGTGGEGRPAGVAPEADLAFVHLSADRATAGLANLGDSTRLLEAVDFLVRIAGGRPWVINLSIGRHGGPHDGCTLVELALDYLLGHGAGRCIVQSAGNYRDKSVHASGRLEPGQTRRLTLRTDPADLTPNELEVWYDGRGEVAVRTESPGGETSRWVSPGDAADVPADGRTVGRLYQRGADPNNHARQVDLFLHPWAPAGAWAVHLRAAGSEAADFHAWLERDDTCLPCQAHFDHLDADARCTIGTIANGHLPLVVGAYAARSPDRVMAAFSSEGPTRDGRHKPDVSAAGVQVLSVWSAPPGARRSPGGLTRKSGTSMAAPAVTGTAALCLQAAGHRLDCRAIRDLVLGAADHAYAGPRTGHGHLDIGATVSALPEIVRLEGVRDAVAA
jgi:subtilisin family serine protease